jgi:hypothetical protein
MILPGEAVKRRWTGFAVARPWSRALGVLDAFGFAMVRPWSRALGVLDAFGMLRLGGGRSTSVAVEPRWIVLAGVLQGVCDEDAGKIDWETDDGYCVAFQHAAG